MNKDWFVYIVRCKDNTLYTGITTDVSRRVVEHNSGGERGAKYTKSRRPVKLVYSEKFTTRAEASIREAAIKKMRREKKLKLIMAE